MHEFNEYYRLGFAYVPIQQFGETYLPKDALDNGTLFPELNIPMQVFDALEGEKSCE